MSIETYSLWCYRGLYNISSLNIISYVILKDSIRRPLIHLCDLKLYLFFEICLSDDFVLYDKYFPSKTIVALGTLEMDAVVYIARVFESGRYRL